MQLQFTLLEAVVRKRCPPTSAKKFTLFGTSVFSWDATVYTLLITQLHTCVSFFFFYRLPKKRPYVIIHDGCQEHDRQLYVHVSFGAKFIPFVRVHVCSCLSPRHSPGVHVGLMWLGSNIHR